MQLSVIKTDGTVEEYLHTKVVGTISNALGAVGQADVFIAEQLAEVVTYFLYHRRNERTVSSNEVFSIVKAVLAATGYEEAAVALSEHHFERKLKRSRTEVICVDVQELSDTGLLYETEGAGNRCRWDKARIVGDLVAKHGICQQTARTIASMVEEKILNMGLTLVSSSLIKQVVLSDAAAVLRAQRQLQMV